MKNSQLEIIQNGLINLVIDDNDSRINYKKATANTKYEFPKIDTLRELKEYWRTKHDIFMVDSSKCLTLIFDDGSEGPLYMYDKSGVKFIKLITPELAKGNNEIIISVSLPSHYIPKKRMKWGHTDYKIQYDLPNYDSMKKKQWLKEAAEDLDGYYNTENIADLVAEDMTIGSLPAIDYCRSKQISAGNSMYKGYLPSIGQMIIFYQYRNMLNYIFKKFDTNTIDMDDDEYSFDRWLTSSEFGNDTIFCMDKSNVEIYSKDMENMFIPFFKKLNNTKR